MSGLTPGTGDLFSSDLLVDNFNISKYSRLSRPDPDLGLTEREKISVRARGSSDLWLSPSRCEAEAQLSLSLREQETDQSDIKCHTSGAKLTLNSPLLSLLYINIKHGLGRNFPFLYL